VAAAVVEDAWGTVSLLSGDGVWDGLVDEVVGAVVIGKRGKAAVGWSAWPVPVVGMAVVPCDLLGL
jgi:hypothetical protein